MIGDISMADNIYIICGTQIIREELLFRKFFGEVP